MSFNLPTNTIVSCKDIRLVFSASCAGAGIAGAVAGAWRAACYWKSYSGGSCSWPVGQKRGSYRRGLDVIVDIPVQFMF